MRFSNNMTLTPQWQGAIGEWVIAQRSAGSPETTIYTRKQHLENLAKDFPQGPWSIIGSELIAWTGSRQWSRETRRGRRSTFLGFWRWGIKAGHTEINPAEELPRVPAGVAKARPAPDSVLDSAMAKATPRERLIMRLAAELGLRRAEVAQIHSDDLFEDLMGWSLRVHGKGSKDRVVPLTPRLAFELRGLEPGWAFPGNDNGHLSPRWVGKIISAIMPDGWTIHTLRHRFASKAYAVDRDVFAVQELLGHSSPATTRRYVQIENESLRRTVLAVAS